MDAKKSELTAGAQINTEAQKPKRRVRNSIAPKAKEARWWKVKSHQQKNISWQLHDSQVLEELLNGDGRGIWADRAISTHPYIRATRVMGIYYGILDKNKRGNELSKKEKRNQPVEINHSVNRSASVCFMLKKLLLGLATASNKARNALLCVIDCII